MTSAIVTTNYRYKRPPKKQKPLALEAPAIVTLRRKENADVPDMTPTEHARRGDAANALWHGLVRRVREGH